MAPFPRQTIFRPFLRLRHLPVRLRRAPAFLTVLCSVAPYLIASTPGISLSRSRYVFTSLVSSCFGACLAVAGGFGLFLTVLGRESVRQPDPDSPDSEHMVLHHRPHTTSGDPSSSKRLSQHRRVCLEPFGWWKRPCQRVSVDSSLTLTRNSSEAKSSSEIGLASLFSTSRLCPRLRASRSDTIPDPSPAQGKKASFRHCCCSSCTRNTSLVADLPTASSLPLPTLTRPPHLLDIAAPSITTGGPPGPAHAAGIV